MLARAWVRVCQDPIIGTEQKSQAFYERIEAVFNRLRSTASELRTADSAKARCRLLHKCCMKFNGSVPSVHLAKPTGVSDVDIEKVATILYNSVKMSSATEECGRIFKSLNAWRLLKGHLKYSFQPRVQVVSKVQWV